ncbi:MAG TPA: CADD family putative folate metabolism protein [Myxococcaceae bacterium]|nr:CADD family putative folate metabolism protein [Myxococcaceae bacterium]
MKLSDALKAIVAERHLLKHPFYQAWSEGRLSQDVLRRYAGQYFAQVDAFPRFVSAVHSQCPEIEARKVLLENLVDEEIKGTDHPELWLRFAEGLGADRAEVKEEVPLPETRAMLETFFGLARGEWTDGLCALYAYESQVPEVAVSKVDGLKKFYGISDDRTLSFFKVHMHYDVEHAGAVADLVDRYAQPERAKAATAQAADALWGFLDGMAREAGVRC